MICTEQERDDLERVLDAAEGWASEMDTTRGKETEIRGSIERIRAMLAPDDAVVRERIKQAVQTCCKECLWPDCEHVDDIRADAVMSVLRGGGDTR